MTYPRSLAPDLARGLMLALIALANSALYLHGRPYGQRLHVAPDGPPDTVVSALLLTFVDGRAYPLFAALFGYGIVRLAARLTPATLRRRQWWLIAFGAAHALLLFSGDVLGTYGLVGLLLVALLRVRDRALLTVAALWLLPTAVVTGLIYGAPPTGTNQRAYLWSIAIEDPLAAAGWRAIEWLISPLPMLGVLSAALVGVVAARRGLLDEPAAWMRPAAVAGIALAVVGAIPHLLTVLGGWQPGTATSMAAAGLHGVTGVAGGLGYAAAIALVSSRLADTGLGGTRLGGTRLSGTRPRRGPVVAALAATGQRSLTAYLVQSVVFTVLLAAWAGGLGRTLTATGVAIVALLTWAATVVAAGLSRRRWPAEVLLRKLAYRRGTLSR